MISSRKEQQQKDIEELRTALTTDRTPPSDAMLRNVSQAMNKDFLQEAERFSDLEKAYGLPRGSILTRLREQNFANDLYYHIPDDEHISFHGLGLSEKNDAALQDKIRAEISKDQPRSIQAFSSLIEGSEGMLLEAPHTAHHYGEKGSISKDLRTRPVYSQHKNNFLNVYLSNSNYSHFRSHILSSIVDVTPGESKQSAQSLRALEALLAKGDDVSELLLSTHVTHATKQSILTTLKNWDFRDSRHTERGQDGLSAREAVPGRFIMQDVLTKTMMRAYKEGTPPVMLQKTLLLFQGASPKEFREVYDSLPDAIDTKIGVDLAKSLPSKAMLRSLGLSPVRVVEAKAAITEIVRGSAKKLSQDASGPEYSEFTQKLRPVFKEFGGMETLRALHELSQSEVIPQSSFKTVVSDIKRIADDRDISFTEQLSLDSPLRDRMALGGVAHFVRNANVGVKIDILKEDAFINEGVFGKDIRDVLRHTMSTPDLSSEKWTSLHMSQAFNSYDDIKDFMKEEFRDNPEALSRATAQLNVAARLYGLIHATTPSEFEAHFTVLTESPETRLLMEQMVDVVGLRRQLQKTVTRFHGLESLDIEDEKNYDLDAVTEKRYDLDRTRLADPNQATEFYKTDADAALRNASYAKVSKSPGRGMASYTVQTKLEDIFTRLHRTPDAASLYTALDDIARVEHELAAGVTTKPYFEAPSAQLEPIAEETGVEEIDATERDRRAREAATEPVLSRKRSDSSDSSVDSHLDSDDEDYSSDD